MDELPTSTRRMFDAARRGYTPSEERLARVRARISDAVQSAPAPTPAGRRDPSPARPWWLSTVALVLVGLLLYSVFGASLSPDKPAEKRAVVAVARPQLPPAPALEPASPLPSERVLEPVKVSAPESTREIREARPLRKLPKPTQRTAVRAEPDPFGPEFDLPSSVASVPLGEVLRDVVAARTDAEKSVPSSELERVEGASPRTDRLADEVSLIAEARRELARGDLSAAERALERHRTEFSVGQLVAERHALHTRVRCARGDRGKAQQSFRELVLRAPGSALQRAVEAACGAALSEAAP